jgi:hypothetical protein
MINYSQYMEKKCSKPPISYAISVNMDVVVVDPNKPSNQSLPTMGKIHRVSEMSVGIQGLQAP